MQAQRNIHVETPQWYVLRDLKRPNSKTLAYKVLPKLGFEIFTPMHWVLKNNRNGGKTRLYVPFIPNLVFVKSIKSELDIIIEKTDTLQYQFVKGAPQNTPMIVPMDDMERFIKAVTSSLNEIYYSIGDITPQMLGKKVMIVGGTMDGVIGNLLKQRGSKKKRLVVQLKDMLVASVEINAGYIKFI